MTVNDPFAPASSESVWTESSKKENVVSEFEGKFVITLKQSGGYDAPWIVIHAKDAEDAKRQLTEAHGSDLPAAVAAAAERFAATKGGAPAPALRQSAPAVQQSAPAQYNTPAPAGGEPVCQHGTKRRIEGKYGPFWGCPAPREEPTRCKPVSIR